LVRTPACHAGGRGSESRPLRNEKIARHSRQFFQLAAYSCFL